MYETKEVVDVEVVYPEPHSKKQAVIMQAFQTPGLKKIYVACGTKFGKSFSASVCESMAASQRPNTVWRWIAPIYEQAKIGMMNYFKYMLPPSPHTTIRENAMRITLDYINTEIQFWHCKNPSSLEGAGIAGNIFDEAAKCPYEAVAAAQTTVTFTKGPQGYFSTPTGKNWFYRECMEAQEHMIWAMKRGKVPERIFLTAPTTENRYIDKAMVEEARRSLPDRLFRQFYLAEFLDDGSVFAGFREAIYGPRLDVYGATQFWIAANSDTLEVFLGIDWAKKEDYTVFTAMVQGPGKPKVVGFMRFTGVGYVDALKQLYKFCKNFKRVIMMRHDRTGVGEAMDDMLAQMSLPFEGVVFTNASKCSMVNDLIMAFERGDIEIPYWPELISELESYTVVTNELGTARYSAPSGMHDDIVSSLMLVNSIVKEYTGEFTLNFLEELPAKKLTVEQWYKNIADDDED